MASILADFIVPNLLFLVFVFLAFSILQSVIVFFLLWLEEQNHERLMVLMLKCYRYYRQLRLMFLAAAVILIGGAAWIIWSFIKSLTGRPELTFFAVTMLVIITLIYFILSNLKGALSLRKRSDGILYFVLSLIVYFFILGLVNQKFPGYQHFMVTNVVDPTVSSIERNLQTTKENSLLTVFRDMAKRGQCLRDDYRRERAASDIHNFVYVATDPELAIKPETESAGDITDIIVGRKCSDGTDTFQLTDWGKWYWVIDTHKQPLSQTN